MNIIYTSFTSALFPDLQYLQKKKLKLVQNEAFLFKPLMTRLFYVQLQLTNLVEPRCPDTNGDQLSSVTGKKVLISRGDASVFVHLIRCNQCHEG